MEKPRLIEDLGFTQTPSGRSIKHMGLLRFGSELIFMLCEIFAVEVCIINRSEDSTFEEDLANDVLEIITVFSARLYGSRSHKNKQIIQQLKQVAKELK
jgi:putative resolvase